MEVHSLYEHEITKPWSRKQICEDRRD